MATTVTGLGFCVRGERCLVDSRTSAVILIESERIAGKLMNRAIIRIVVFACAFVGPRPIRANPPRDPEWIARGKSEMVAADSEYASKAGLAMLEAGGNAIDAAVAVSFALAVTRPYSTGLGGGGFMIARMSDGTIIVQDFREIAPAASTPDMFIKAKAAQPARPSPSEFGYLAVAVPGLVAGRCQALAQWGTMPLAKALQPAINLARNGFPVDDDYVRTAKELLEIYEKNPSLKESCGYVYRTHLGGGNLPRIGDKLVQPELARLLESLASNGPDFFYRGPVAADIVLAMKKYGGVISEKDLADYRPAILAPYTSSYHEYKLILMPQPSSGGIAIAETLNILEPLGFAAIARSDLGLATHLQVEALKHAFADRARLPLPQVARFLSKSYSQRISDKLSHEETASISSYGISNLNDSGTSHFSIIDRHGNAVVSTETINTSFGSLAAIEEWGLILNNEMDDFTVEPGKPNAFGLIQSAENAPNPGAKPLSSMSPTIVLKDDRVFALLGASGGPRIITSVLNVLLQIVDRGSTLEQAISAPRPHHQGQPDEINFDREPNEELASALRKRGHKISDKRKTGIVQAILRDGEGWVGASDPRKGGKPAGR